MNNANFGFRTPRDEFMDIENRWRLISSREANLDKREREVRAREEDIRRFLHTNPAQMPMPPPPPVHNRNNRKGFKNKDYSQFAVNADTKVCDVRE